MNTFFETNHSQNRKEKGGLPMKSLLERLHLTTDELGIKTLKYFKTNISLNVTAINLTEGPACKSCMSSLQSFHNTCTGTQRTGNTQERTYTRQRALMSLHIVVGDHKTGQYIAT